MNKLRNITVLLVLFVNIIANAQSIRKNHQEMTPSEKDALVSAFYQLRNGPDLINDIALFHSNNFGDIHFNLPDNPEDDVFFAWHRRNLLELEHAMQEINPKISIPFWDWTSDNSTTSDLWDYNFLGQFDSDWSLNRNLGGAQLPTSSDVNNVQSIANWLDYSDTLERGIVHVGGHLWTGGVMTTGASPRDPVFFLHHGMVDKLWQDWVEMNGITSSSNIYQKTSLPRYDGTYTFDGEVLPLVNPDDIVDSKSLGVFFAENQLAELEDYTVSNTYNSQETFYYQYIIEAGDNFVVPNGNSAKMESLNQVVLKPGFHAQSGSVFIAKIDGDNDINTLWRSSNSENQNQKEWDDITILENAYENKSLANNGASFDEMSLLFYPNPAANAITVEVRSQFSTGMLQIVDLLGKEVLRKELNGTHEEFDISRLESGVYIIRIAINGKFVLTKKLSKL